MKSTLLGALSLLLSFTTYAGVFTDANGEEPYVPVFKIEDTWIFGLAGQPTDFFGWPDIQKYILGERRDAVAACIENPKYQGNLRWADETEAYKACEENLNVMVRNLNQNDWRIDFQKLDPSQESAVMEALEDTWRELKLTLTGRGITPLDDSNEYAQWQKTMTNDFLKIPVAILQIFKLPVKLVAGVGTGIVGLIIFPFEKEKYLGDTARRGLGLTLKSTLDTVTIGAALVQGTIGPIIYVTATTLGPAVVVAKESSSIVSELKAKIKNR